MFSHIIVGVSDFERAVAFYNTVFGVLGIEQRFFERDKPRAGWQTRGGSRPLFLIGHPFDGQPHQPGNGQMAAFAAHSRDQVEDAYRLALSLGAADEGAPGLRWQYHANCYDAYFRDLDGNKLCVVCNEAESP